MAKYCLEFILSLHSASAETVKNAVIEFAQGVEVCELAKQGPGQHRDFRLNLRTEDPTVIFDTCAQFGRIKSVKITEENML